jgi:hypothetical protein
VQHLRPGTVGWPDLGTEGEVAGGPAGGLGVQCSTVRCSTVQCGAVRCSAVHCSAVLCSALHCSGAVQYLRRGVVGGPGLEPDGEVAAEPS